MFDDLSGHIICFHLSQYSRHFLYSSPAQPLGPEDLVWRMVCTACFCNQIIGFSIIFYSICIEMKPFKSFMLLFQMATLYVIE